MNYAITSTGNPYQNNNVVISDGTNRIAKLNNNEKRPAIARFWQANRPDLKTFENEVKKEASPLHGYDVVLSRLGMTMEAYETYCLVNGFRKLKVNSVVNKKALRGYNSCPKEEIKKEEIKPVIEEKPANEVAQMESIVPQEEPKEMPLPTREETREEIRQEPIRDAYQSTLPVNESRTTRYTDVINAPSRVMPRQEETRVMDNVQVVNTLPSRSERNSSLVESNVYADSVNSLVNDDAYQSKIVVGESSRNLDMINNTTHYGNDSDGIFSETVKLQEQTSAIKNETAELNGRIINLEQELAARERRVKEKEAMHKQNEYNKAKKAYKLASEEKYSKTSVYKDLASKIKELQEREAQLDELNSSYEEENSSYGMRRAA